MECYCYNNKVKVKWNFPSPTGTFLRGTKISIHSVIRKENCRGKAWTHAQEAGNSTKGSCIYQEGLLYLREKRKMILK